MKPSLIFCILLLLAFESCLRHSTAIDSSEIDPQNTGRVISGTADFDSRFRYQFVVLKGVIYIRRIIHPGDSQQKYSKSHLSTDDFQFFDRISKLSGVPLPFAPPGPLATITHRTTLADVESVKAFHSSESSNSFRQRLMNILQTRFNQGDFASPWPTSIKSALE
jgi:hypothetical protein